MAVPFRHKGGHEQKVALRDVSGALRRCVHVVVAVSVCRDEVCMSVVPFDM